MLPPQMEVTNIVDYIENPIIKSVVLCESHGKQFNDDGTIVTGKAGEKGIGQFMPKTWERMEAEFYAEEGKHLDINSAKDQLALMQFAFNHHYQNEWTCYREMPK